MSLLTISDLRKSFGGLHALDGATLDLHPNKINLLIGANGSGKSTLINTISGLWKPNGGRVTLRGKDITGFPPHRIFEHGIMRTFQIPKHFAGLSLMENMLMAHPEPGESFRKALVPLQWKSYEASQTKKALGILESLELLHLKDKLSYEISGGQIKLLELGKTLMADMEIIMLDEPIAGVNPTLAHKIFKKIKEILKGGVTFLIIEHRLDIALHYSDYVFVMGDGRVVAHDLPDRILDNKAVQESYLGK